MKTKEIIKTYYLDNPSSKKRVRELERELDLSLPSIINSVNMLCKENILIKEKVSSIVLFCANRSSNEYILEKKLHNLRKIYSSGLIDYFKFELSNPVIILFGSYLRGEDSEISDIDIFVESEKFISVRKFEKLIGKKIHIFGYSNIKHIKNKELANNILNGLVLNGYLEIM